METLTKAPALIKQFSPSSIPGKIVALAPIDTPLLITVFDNVLGSILLRG